MGFLYLPLTQRVENYRVRGFLEALGCEDGLGSTDLSLVSRGEGTRTRDNPGPVGQPSGAFPIYLGRNFWWIRSLESGGAATIIAAKGVNPGSSMILHWTERRSRGNIRLANIGDMPQSNARVFVHAVFATEDRAPKLVEDWRVEAFAYIGGTLRDIGCKPIEIGGVQDHVHALFELGREITLSETMRTVKTASTKWIKRQFIEDFGWQKGYGAFSVSHSNLSQVVSYIRNQEDHHKALSYEDELRSIFAEHGIVWDPRDF